MNLKWIKKLTLPVLTMLFVYYSQSLGSENLYKNNTVTSINEQPKSSGLEVSSQTHHVIYGLHESNYVVKTYVEKDLELSLIESIFKALTVDLNTIHPEITSLISGNATLLDYELQDGDLVLNLSESFLEYIPEDEQQMLSSLVWTFTDLDEVDRVSFKIEGESVTNLNGSLTVQRGVTRSIGLNLEVDLDMNQLDNSKLVVLYFLTDDSSEGFLVPVTRLIASETNAVTYIIESLIMGPIGQDYISVFNHQTTLLEEPNLENGLLTLNFSSDLYYNMAQTKVSSAMLRQLVMSLTDIDQVESVSVNIEGNVNVFDDQLNSIAVPMIRSAYESFIEI